MHLEPATGEGGVRCPRGEGGSKNFAMLTVGILFLFPIALFVPMHGNVFVRPRRIYLYIPMRHVSVLHFGVGRDEYVLVLVLYKGVLYTRGQNLLKP